MTIGKNLGNSVSTRTTSWLDLCLRAWGSEFYAPDHGVYDFRGHKWDSTDKFTTGLYGIVGDNDILMDGERYPDMRDSLNKDYGAGFPNGAQNIPIGGFDELQVENSAIASPYAPPLAVSDVYYNSVQLLIHSTLKDSSNNNFTINNSGAIAVTNAPLTPFGDNLALAQLTPGTTNNALGMASSPFSTNLQQLPGIPYTLEFSMCCTAFPSGTSSFMHGDNGTALGISFALTNTGLLKTTGDIVLSFGTISLNKWYQVALTFDGNVTSLNKLQGYLNGVNVVTQTAYTQPSYPSVSITGFQYGTEAPGAYTAFTGYLTEIRYTPGVQRYGATYTPATTRFPNIAPS